MSLKNLLADQLSSLKKPPEPTELKPRDRNEASIKVLDLKPVKAAPSNVVEKKSLTPAQKQV